MTPNCNACTHENMPVLKDPCASCIRDLRAQRGRTRFQPRKEDR
jgi:hypothetical protein